MCINAIKLEVNNELYTASARLPWRVSGPGTHRINTYWHYWLYPKNIKTESKIDTVLGKFELK